MLHIHRFDRTAPDEVLRAMFAARKAVFCDLLKWDVPVLANAYELDQFDDEHASYLILADRAHRHLGSARLLPTTRPHILGSLYPQLCEVPPPAGPDKFEITRFCLDRSLRAAGRRKVRNALVTALVDHALARGIAQTAEIEGRAAADVYARGVRDIEADPRILPATELCGKDRATSPRLA